MIPTEITKWSPSHGYLQQSFAEPKQAAYKTDTGHSQEFALTERTPVSVSIASNVNRQYWLDQIAMQAPDRPNNF